jgi:hypothetical protein
VRRLSILLVAVWALLVAPAAHAETGVEPVKVVITGSGAGTVYSSPESPYRGSPEIDCAYKSPGPQTGICETFMSREGGAFEQIFLTAKAAPGSIFSGWKVENAEFEGCTGTVTVCAPYLEPSETGNGEATVIATFDAEPSTPNLTVVVLGEGTVVSNPPGIVCPPTCGANFTSGAVKLTASPAADWAFSAWSGCIVKAGLTCEVLTSEAGPVMATFVATPLLTVEKAGTGYGKVITTGYTGLSCDESCSKSTSGIKTGSSVTVKATPAKGSEFVGFEGGTGNGSLCSATCTFTISEKSSVKAKFSPIPSKTLTVKLKGPGAYKGKVTGKGVTVRSLLAAAISCGSGCTTETETFFATGTTELVATPARDYSFAGWTVEGGSAGTCVGTTASCALLTDADKTVEAEFE